MERLLDPFGGGQTRCLTSGEGEGERQRRALVTRVAGDELPKGVCLVSRAIFILYQELDKESGGRNAPAYAMSVA